MWIRYILEMGQISVDSGRSDFKSIDPTVVGKMRSRNRKRGQVGQVTYDDG